MAALSWLTGGSSCGTAASIQFPWFRGVTIWPPRPGAPHPGVGALKSGIVAVGREGRLEVLARTFYPHSPGEFWEAITAICGFHHMKHGGKITGLAAYGDPEASCYQVMEGALGANGLTIRSAIDPVRMARKLEGFSREDIAA